MDLTGTVGTGAITIFMSQRQNRYTDANSGIGADTKHFSM